MFIQSRWFELHNCVSRCEAYETCCTIACVHRSLQTYNISVVKSIVLNTDRCCTLERHFSSPEISMIMVALLSYFYNSWSIIDVCYFTAGCFQQILMVSLHRHAFCWTVDKNRWTVVSVLSLLSTIDGLCCTTLHLSKHADRSCCAIAAYLGKMNEQYGTDMHHVNLCECSM